jgi:hypothetical protein
MPKIIAHRFRLDGSPQTGLSPTIDIYNATTDALVISGAAMTEIGTTGTYKYIYTEGNGFDQTVDYIYLADGTATITNDSERFVEGACCAAEPEVIGAQVADDVWTAPAASYADINTMGGRHNANYTNILQLLVDVDFIRKFQTNRTRIDTIANTLTVYDDDGITPLWVFDLKDGAGVGSSDPVCERDPM